MYMAWQKETDVIHAFCLTRSTHTVVCFMHPVPWTSGSPGSVGLRRSTPSSMLACRWSTTWAPSSTCGGTASTPAGPCSPLQTAPPPWNNRISLTSMYYFSILRSLQIIKHKLPSFNFSHIIDSFYETHLINVPLDLFSPACKEEEYCSLDRKESIKLKTMISACSVTWCFKIYCVAQLSAQLARQWFSNYFWGVTKTFPFLVWYTLCQSSQFVLWDGQACGQKAEWRVGHRLQIALVWVHLKRRFSWCKGAEGTVWVEGGVGMKWK